MKSIFTKILKSNQIITKNIEKYNVNWMNKFYGKAQTILLPSNTRDVSNILKTCNSNKILIHIQGGSNCFSYSYSTLRINKNERKRN